jgi:hypothetical protein
MKHIFIFLLSVVCFKTNAQTKRPMFTMRSPQKNISVILHVDTFVFIKSHGEEVQSLFSRSLRIH